MEDEAFALAKRDLDQQDGVALSRRCSQDSVVRLEARATGLIWHAVTSRPPRCQVSLHWHPSSAQLMMHRAV